MCKIPTFWLTLFLATVVTAAAQPVSQDSQMAQVMLSEFRQLRQELQNTAATIQRVQIAMYRLQGHATLLQRATERRDQSNVRCRFAQERNKSNAQEIEKAEARKRNAQNPADQNSAEETLAQLRSFAETSAEQVQKCQGEQMEAEAEFRTEQAKTDELENQLNEFDQVLARNGGK